MSDSLPSVSHDPDAAEQLPPANAEDRKAAAALSALHTNDISAEPGKPFASGDQEALGKAMSRLEIAAGKEAAVSRAADPKKDAGVVKKKAVKVSAENVNLLVQELDLSKAKATELLKAHDGDLREAIRGFIAPLGA
ncbi:huntingtin-interacting protein K [Aspergillus clavatus NRRL 1]|uniref:Nascent polypeptide-associated complex subunit alpha-like UBA domain-containing protein n=1 Tax=Aspergillus clavatus (strain ATCC 1007 / CBS 513.65 / DSM 816 / NCTC 3887 / NRRL 1 / QM 1276 / 107) TaxID=344612 RepID=A1CHI5_ASPCL|nr:uncharacterized protein ACLA_048090 [Aspergillus clavatus NRRL 1]EAW10340.1 conserved hypothetical protein [Aspergillus clavatus NRRL 1]